MEIVRLECYYQPKEMRHTTEYYSTQLRMFIFKEKQYPGIPIKEIVIDSEASHFDNRLTVDGIPHDIIKKGAWFSK